MWRRKQMPSHAVGNKGRGQCLVVFPFWCSLGVCSLYIQEAVSPWISRINNIDGTEEPAGESLVLHSQGCLVLPLLESRLT